MNNGKNGILIKITKIRDVRRTHSDGNSRDKRSFTKSKLCKNSLVFVSVDFHNFFENLRIIDDQDVIYVSEHEMLRGGE